LVVLATRLFPVWALLFSALAYARPAIFTPLRGAIVPLLGLVMFGMGMTLLPRHFVEVARRPAPLVAGVVLQFGVMPLAAFCVARALSLPVELATGLVLVGSCPGGTASNVICYLARADVALSVAVTTASTLLAVLATPLLTELYVGRSVEVDVVGMFLSILRVVVLPVALGVTLNRLAGELGWLARARSVLPLVSVAAIVVIIAIVVALNRAAIRETSALALLAVALHNTLGLLSGYVLAGLLGFGEARRRTLAIEVGMQNSGLGVALALEFFTPLAALPGALFSIWHNLSGSLLASWWSRR
jgi:BASS family bile acid:Na+ symporter